MEEAEQPSRSVARGLSYIAALQLAEEREAEMRGAFNRFDIDNSGTMDMDELLVLLDELGLLEKLRSDMEEFVCDMFVKYDTNSDGVLSFEEFIGVHNACLDDCMGRRKKITAPRTGYSTVDARKKLAAEKARKKAAEAVRIQKQNAEMKARLQAQGKGRDPKALDAEIEEKRRAIAKARADAKAAEKARLLEENRANRARLKNVQAVTDDDITDEAAGFARVEAAAASQARAAAEAEQLTAENREMHERLVNTAPRTVDELS
jgi:hypothetical protein